jgi:hypothetical protein
MSSLVPPKIREPLRPTYTERLRDRDFWRFLFGQYRTVMKLTLLINLGLLSVHVSLHAAQLRAEENERPTSSDMSFATRYRILRARMHNAWNPWGEAQGEEEVKYQLDCALEGAEEELAATAGGGGGGRGIEGMTEGWRQEFVKLRRDRGRWFERDGRYVDAEQEYCAALEVPVLAGAVVEERVAAAMRLAKILEWRGEMEGAMGMLLRGVGYAFPPAIEDLGSGATGILPEMPRPGAKENTGVLMGVATELGVFLARHGQIAKALEVLAAVLARRKAAGGVPDPKRFNTEVGDPCAEAATMAMVGELMFAIGKKKEGVAWSEEAYEQAWKLVEFRLACKECCVVAAVNLVKMGELLKSDAGQETGWFSGKKKEEMAGEGQRLVDEYTYKQLEVDAVKAVRDAEQAEAATKI